MTWVTIIGLIVIWYIGLTSSYAFGGLIHIPLILAAIIFVLKFVTGRKLDL